MRLLRGTGVSSGVRVQVDLDIGEIDVMCYKMCYFRTSFQVSR
jgi:hypothetical protein